MKKEHKVYFRVIPYHKQRKDNTYSVKIRISFKSKYAEIYTSYSVSKTELNKKGEIKNQTILNSCNKKISDYYKTLESYDYPESATVHDIKKFLFDESAQKIAVGAPLDFLGKFEEYLEKNRTSASYRIYSATYNHLRSFAGVKLPIENITPDYLTDFERYLAPKMGSRGVNLYMSRVKAIYRWIMDNYEGKAGYQFNYPFSRTKLGNKYKIPKAKYPKTKALTKTQLRAIIETPLTGIRANRARDLFVISLLSLGTNAKDLYLLDSIGKHIEYNRSKTKDKRDDEAFISITVQPELKPYIEKYWNKACTRPFAQMYASPEQLNKAIMEGLKQVVRQVNKLHGNGFLWDIDYYDARRSMASVMRNSLYISKGDVSQCLNHVDGNRITDAYIEQDFAIIDRCNRMFIDWLFSESASDDQH